MKRMTAAALFLLTSVTAGAVQTDNNRTIDHLGTAAGSSSASIAYFSTVEGFALDCEYGNIYVDLTVDWGRAAYAQLLSAKLTGKKLSRIDYSQPGGAGTDCTLALVEIQN